MDDKTLQALLTALAQNLGTTVEHLWGVILWQVRVTAITEIVLFLLAVVACCLWYRIVRRKTTEDPETRKEWDDCGGELAWVSVPVSWLALFLVLCFKSSWWIAAFFNPEYAALRDLLGCTSCM
jgi:heme/copper-type cytochrome/quinol oxidase subunit 2